MATRAIPSSAIGATAVEVGLVLIIILGSILHNQGGVSSTTLLLFLLLSLVLYQPMQELSSLAAYRRNQQQIAAKLSQVWDVATLSEPSEPVIPEGTSIEFRHVSFAYEKNPVLSEVSFRALPGQVTAIVGASGAGKSTLAHLSARMWDVDAGSVVIGGKDIRDLGQDNLFEALTVVPQEPIFSMTRCGRTSPSPARQLLTRKCGKP
ncbi:ABC transporter ATP-binding protein/permease [Schaalia sp. Marseille-Q2122]|uniref:ATP-binding cassette domain-containing protein n=1 Tax=Schaalia sp. Marseille-Q2122 TaxID=2736604 RepID=UPI001589724B|nr:ABC transporter ATP-binding protein/permease [Schaalia sp. Marseille-Q2122]